MSVIDKPGFYTSKHGKCEVLNVDGGWAFGYRFSKCRQKMSVPTFWEARNGRNHHGSQYDITGPYIEPRKPVEAWAIFDDEANGFVAATISSLEAEQFHKRCTPAPASSTSVR